MRIVQNRTRGPVQLGRSPIMSAFVRVRACPRLKRRSKLARAGEDGRCSCFRTRFIPLSRLINCPISHAKALPRCGGGVRQTPKVVVSNEGVNLYIQKFSVSSKISCTEVQVLALTHTADVGLFCNPPFVQLLQQARLPRLMP